MLKRGFLYFVIFALVLSLSSIVYAASPAAQPPSQPAAPQTASQSSCAGRCGNYDSAKSCQCDSACANYGDCCSDKKTVCG
ncbi:MAG: hypothetical protein AABX00_01940 [Nanoarchaeota archaeon]